MEDNFPSNSDRPKTSKSIPGQPGPTAAPKKEIKKVVSGEVMQRKKSRSRRFKENFIKSEDGTSVLQNIIKEVLLPAARDAVYQAGDHALQQSLFGQVRSRRGPVVGPMVGGLFGNATYNAYNRIANPNTSLRPPDPRDQQPSAPAQQRRATQADLQEIILASRAEATEVLDQMIAIIAQYGSASVSDLYALLGVTGEFTDESWGWTDLMGADVQRINEGYLLMLPRPQGLPR